MVNIAFEIIAGNVVTQWKNAKTINNPLSLNCRTLSLFLKKKLCLNTYLFSNAANSYPKLKYLL